MIRLSNDRFGVMKPSFALSLSFDGIRLLHRAAGGWRVVGGAALDADDLAGELAVLRRTATALQPAGMRSKLLLPNEQIKYLSIDTPGMSDAARRRAAAEALDGATPYAVSELAFDISADGDRTHVAAVARETLEEAEAFATEHRFNPVSFAAVPGENPYLGEPHFGETRAAAKLLEPGEKVEPDGIAVVVIGDIEMPKGPVVPPEESAEKPKAPPAPEAKPAETPTAAPKAPPAAETPAAPKPAPPVAPVPVAAPPVAADAAPALGFASRRAPRETAAPQLGGAQRDAAPAAPAEPEPDLPGEADVTAPRIDIEPETPAFVAAPTPDERPAQRSGFLSRRKPKQAKSPRSDARVIPAPPAPAPADVRSEQERMTVFGARRAEVGGKPRFLGLILTAALLIFLAGVAAWASVFLEDGLKLSRLFGDRDRTPTFSDPAENPAEDPVAAAALVTALPPPQPVAPEPQIVTASLEPTLSEEDAAVLDALSEPAQPLPPVELSETELAARYAATGIWPIAPDVPQDPADQIDIEDLYLTSIDPVSTSADAIALPAPATFGTDEVLASLASPPAAGTQFAFDDRGLVIPTASGALSPEGHLVIAGRPPLVPPATPTRFQSEPEDTAIRSALAAVRPQPRPSDLVENTERAQLDGLTRNELADLRPVLRPQSLQEAAAALSAPSADGGIPPQVTDGAVALAMVAPDPFESATKNAIDASRRPDTRPRNFERIVKRAERSRPAEPQEEVRVASAATVAPRVVEPSIPSKTSVATQATVKNALNLRQINLIGVYGKPSNRRALVRLGNGRYQKVVVGDRLDGGRVSAIGDSELRYSKRGRDYVLKMPR